MPTLMERARKLILNKPVLLGALAIVPLSSAARTADALAPAPPYSFVSGSAIINGPGPSGGQVQGTFGTFGGTGSNPLRLNVSVPVVVTAQDYSSAIATSVDLTWQGHNNPTFFPVNNSTIKVDYDFIIALTGQALGNVTWTLTDNIGGLSLNTSSVSPVTGASTEITGELTLPVTSPVSFSWSSVLSLSWSGYSPEAQLSVSVPSSTSIDLSVVPEPASLSLLGISGVGLLARRRRRE